MASLSGIRNVSAHPASVKPASRFGRRFVATNGFCTIKAAISALPGRISPAFIPCEKNCRMTNVLSCRPDCGACCTAPSISSAIPGMPNGKPAGVRCVQLDDNNLCRIFGRPERPAVCGGLQPQAEMCGNSRDEAMIYLMTLERLTAA